MAIAGWILIVLGTLAFLGGLILAVLEQWKQFTNKSLVDVNKASEISLRDIARILEQFAKLSIGIQWAILGLVAVYLGSRLIGLP